MTAAELIERLQGLPPDALVYAFDANTGQPEPVTGYVIERINSLPTVREMVVLQTDDPF